MTWLLKYFMFLFEYWIQVLLIVSCMSEHCLWFFSDFSSSKFGCLFVSNTDNSCVGQKAGRCGLELYLPFLIVVESISINNIYCVIKS